MRGKSYPARQIAAVSIAAETRKLILFEFKSNLFILKVEESQSQFSALAVDCKPYSGNRPLPHIESAYLVGIWIGKQLYGPCKTLRLKGIEPVSGQQQTSGEPQRFKPEF